VQLLLSSSSSGSSGFGLSMGVSSSSSGSSGSGLSMGFSGSSISSNSSNKRLIKTISVMISSALMTIFCPFFTQYSTPLFRIYYPKAIYLRIYNPTLKKYLIHQKRIANSQTLTFRL